MHQSKPASPKTLSTVALVTALTAWLAISPSVSAQPRAANVGYLYPAGGQRGSVVHVVVGGQFLRQATDVLISGEGVRASILKHFKPITNMNREQKHLVLTAMLDAWNGQLRRAGLGKERIAEMQKKMLSRPPWSMLKKKDIDTTGETMPEHPLLTDLNEKSLEELLHAFLMIHFPRNKLQINRQLAELLLIEVTIDRDALPGDRTLCIKTRTGQTQPVVFQIGDLPEVVEYEPNDTCAVDLPWRLQKLKDYFSSEPLDSPLVINGQIMPGDVDRFSFHAEAGTRLVIEAAARQLIPYLADAVPGWFQATLTLYDPEKREVAFVDDHLFHPDPVMTYDVPQSGEHELEIRDAIYRGREDFVYRISIRNDDKATSTSHANQHVGRPFSTGVSQACNESEPNNTRKHAQRISTPIIIEGLIDAPGDVDLFRIDGVAGQELVAQVYARQIGSPMDSLVRVLDRTGKTLAWNDDHVRKDGHLHVSQFGLTTHHADAYLTTTLPDNGTYYVQLSDAQRHGGEDHMYRLRISEPMPDFTLIATPSRLYARPGEIIPIQVYALRRDGFDGPITMGMGAASGGFSFTGGNIIPAGRNTMQMTIRAPSRVQSTEVALGFVGTARHGQRTIRREASAADNVMQAFLYRHLLPREETSCVFKKQKWSLPPLLLARESPIVLVPGSTATVRIDSSRTLRDLERWKLVLVNPPDGVGIEGTPTPCSGGFELTIRAEEKAKPENVEENIVVAVHRVLDAPSPKGRAGRKSTWPIGTLPAIPIHVQSPAPQDRKTETPL